jgi:hypothetical protein
MNSSYTLPSSTSSWDYSGRAFSGADLDLPPSAGASRRAADRYALLSAAAERRRASRGRRRVGRVSAWRRARSAVARTA